MATTECYIRDVMALENVEPKKKKGTLAKIADRGGGGLENRLKVEIIHLLKIF